MHAVQIAVAPVGDAPPRMKIFQTERGVRERAPQEIEMRGQCLFRQIAAHPLRQLGARIAGTKIRAPSLVPMMLIQHHAAGDRQQTELSVFIAAFTITGVAFALRYAITALNQPYLALSNDY